MLFIYFMYSNVYMLIPNSFLAVIGGKQVAEKETLMYKSIHEISEVSITLFETLFEIRRQFWY